MDMTVRSALRKKILAVQQRRGLDDAGTTTKMTRLRGRSAKGERLNSKALFGHWGTQTFVAGLKCDGLIAPWVVDAPMNRTIFEVMSKPSSHPPSSPATSSSWITSQSLKSERDETFIRNRGAWLLCLPPTAQTSIPSKWHSPNSKPISGRLPPEPSTISGKPSETSVRASLRRNAPNFFGAAGYGFT